MPYSTNFQKRLKMTETEDSFIKLVDEFVLVSKEPEVLEEIGQLDREARLLGITFYDMYCVVLQDVAGHQNLISQFKIFMNAKKTV
ncbi:MAG: hypothetical protein D4R72_00075 [Nitrosopumilales archaeon]|nr:MAG: hypothetical protein D4R72_00075 [Nitrosopumilales archaeon]